MRKIKLEEMPQITPQSFGRRRGYDSATQKPVELVSQKRHYKLITPLFGGGREAGVPDENQPVSGKAIRGHLRFWWRAMRGGRFGGSLEEMRKAERRIWGGAAKGDDAFPPLVGVLVRSLNNKQDPFEWATPFNENSRAQVKWDAVSYAAFPLQPEETGKSAGRVLEYVAFELEIAFPESERAEVEAALWAWETFGGVGARTRRGFGALWLDTVDGIEEPTINAARAQEIIREKLGKFTTPGPWPDHVPYIDGRFVKTTGFIKSQDDNDFAAWSYLIKQLRKFRQARNLKEITDHNGNVILDRNGQPKMAAMGRSHWPEPDEIRRLTRQHLGQGRPNAPKTHAPVHPVRAFPRAVFGLPIVFKFKDNRYDKNNADLDPAKTTLQFKDFDRWSSPLILRPLACSNQSSVGLACILRRKGAPPSDLVLKDTAVVSLVITRDDATCISSLSDTAEAGNPKFCNVLTAFLDTLK